MGKDDQDTVREDIGYRTGQQGRDNSLGAKFPKMTESETSKELKDSPEPSAKCRIRLRATNRECNYAWWVAEELIKHGKAEFLRWV